MVRAVGEQVIGVRPTNTQRPQWQQDCADLLAKATDGKREAFLQWKRQPSAITEERYQQQKRIARREARRIFRVV